MYPINRYLAHFVVLVALLPALSFAEKTKINIHIPSGVTSEMSRLYSRIINDFERTHPQIDVIFHPSNSYQQVLQNVLTLNNQNKSAGVAAVEISQLLTLRKANAIIALDEFVDAEKDDSFIKAFVPEFLANSYGNDGKLYGIPLIRSTPIIYYNMSTLKKAGIDRDKLPSTWQELTATLKKIKAVTGSPPFILAPQWYDWLFEAFVFQNNGTLANQNNSQVQFDHPATIEALAYWKMLLDSGLMSRYGGSWKSMINGFSQGTFPVIYYSSGGLGKLVDMESQDKLGFEWMTDIMPKNKTYSTPVGAANMFLSQHMSPKEKKAAWLLVNHLLQPEIQAQISYESGYFPVVKFAYKEKNLIQRYSTEQFKRAIKQLSYSKAKIMTLNAVQIRNILKAAIDRVLDDNMDAKESLSRAQHESQKWLN